MINIILCGGNGTRLWPISRSLMPKQFVKLFDEQSLFQLTVERNLSLCNEQFVVSNMEQYFLAYEQLEEIKVDNNRYLLEPVARNTAPAIALACFALKPDDIVLVSPSDHLIKNVNAYEEAVRKAKKYAEDGFLVTFGVKPTFAETGFGYIEANGDDAVSFREKPDLETAKQYFQSGDFYWNSGMFCFSAKVFLEELEKYSPDIFNACKNAYEKTTLSKLMRIEAELMTAIPEDSIDYAVMEKSDKVKVIHTDMGWSDLGSFDALDTELEKDNNGNTLCEHLYSIKSKNNFVYSTDRIVALAGVEDLIVVDTGDVVMITKKGDSQIVKEVVKKVKSSGSSLHHIHLTAHRPWGTYTILEEDDKYKIKRIVVKPGKRLSLQKHFHRSEHWIVVSGTAIVQVGEEETLVRTNESTYIPMGELHRLANPGKIELILIEAQVGQYLGEDDIVRISDDFSRE